MSRRARAAALLVGLAAGARAGLPPTAVLAAFVDSVVAAHQARWHTPGVAVAVVQGSELRLLRGYGLADVESRRPVDPARTVFPLFSVTKTFTAALALQLVEESKLGLREDVNRFLDRVRVPTTFPEPITLHHLLTHTSGLDERLVGMARPLGGGSEDLAGLLARELPVRIRPPGQVFQYSIGYGTTLVGAMIERATGLDFATALRTRLLEPLGMRSSRVGYEPAMEPDYATGYLWARHRLHKVPRGVELTVAPAGGLHATAADAARFMAALLRGGELDGKRILSPAAVASMTRAEWSPGPGFPGVGYGFFMTEGLGVQHAGGPLPHLSAMVLVPEQGVGIFFASNAPSGILLIRDLAGELIRRYCPGAGAGAAPPAGPLPRAADLAGLAGTYRCTWYPRSDFLGILALAPWFHEVAIEPGPGGGLRLTHSTLPVVEDLEPVGNLLFARPEGRGPVRFETDPAGRGLRFHAHAVMPLAYFPHAFERITWWEGRWLHYALLALFLAGLPWIGWVGPLWRAWRGSPRPDRFGLLAILVADADLALLVAPLAFLSRVAGPAGLGALGTVPPGIRAVLALGWVAAAGTGVLAVRALARGEGRGRALLLVAFVGFARYWRLLAALP